jgi:hypothetical protein
MSCRALVTVAAALDAAFDAAMATALGSFEGWASISWTHFSFFAVAFAASRWARNFTCPCFGAFFPLRLKSTSPPDEPTCPFAPFPDFFCASPAKTAS